MNKRNLAIGLAIVALMLVATLVLDPTITGFATYSSEDIYTHHVNDMFADNNSVLVPINGSLVSLAISGDVRGEGSARVYLDTGKEKLLVYEYLQETVSGPIFTGRVTGNSEQGNETNNTEEIIAVNQTENKTTKNKTIEINATIEENANSNKTIEVNESKNTTANTTVNVTVNNTVNSTLNETSNVTVNQTTNVTVNNTANKTTNETLNKTVEEEIIAVNQTENETTLPPREEVISTFEQTCVDTCTLEGLNASNYTLLIEVDGVELYLKEVSYGLAKEITPLKQTSNISDEVISIGETIQLDLAEYFILGEDILFDTVTVAGIEQAIVDEQYLAITGVKEGAYELFVYATNDEDLLRSNTFTVYVVESIIDTLVLEEVIESQ